MKEEEYPRCGQSLAPNGYIWPYEFPFDVNENFETKINQIGVLARLTRFLLLTRPFALEDFNMVKAVAEMTEPITIEGTLYQGRKSPVERNLTQFAFHQVNMYRRGDTTIRKIRSFTSRVISVLVSKS